MRVVPIVLGTVIALMVVVESYAMAKMSGGARTYTVAPVSASASASPEPVKVNAKKLTKRERAYVTAVEEAAGRNLPAFHERMVLSQGRTYCVARGAGFTKSQVIALYGKERPELPGIDLLALSGDILCAPKK